MTKTKHPLIYTKNFLIALNKTIFQSYAQDDWESDYTIGLACLEIKGAGWVGLYPFEKNAGELVFDTFDTQEEALTWLAEACETV